MPELPEVQTIVDNLESLGIVGRRFAGADIGWPKTIAEPSPQLFCQIIKGCTIRGIARRGKFIIMTLSRGMTLLIHLRMTGRLNWRPSGKARDRHEHVIFKLGGAYELRFQDTRKFGRIWLTETPQQVLKKLGPEPLTDGFTDARFYNMLQRRKRAIKPLLLDQTFIAGLGNIYTNEALWKAKIHPLRVSTSLSRQQAGALCRSIVYVLSTGLRNLGTTLGSGKGNFYSVGGRRGRNAGDLKVFRRTGQACPRCGAGIERIIVAQRGSYVCPACQPSPGIMP